MIAESHGSLPGMWSRAWSVRRRIVILPPVFTPQKRGPLPVNILIFAALRFPREALAFDSCRSLLKRFLVTAEPSIPAILLRSDATPDEVLHGISQVPLVLYNRLRIPQLVDFQHRMAICKQLSKPHKRVGSQAELVLAQISQTERVLTQF